MEEVLNFTKQACELARKLELELPNMATNNPDMLFSSIDDVEKAFGVAKEKVMMMLSQQDTTTTTTPILLSHDVFMQKAQEGQMGGSATPMQDLMRGGIHANTMDQLLLMQHPFDVSVFLENKMLSSKGSLRIGEMGGRDDEGLERSKGLEGDMQGIEASPSRPRKSRKNDLEKRTVMRPAPQVGNTEVPPEDGFTWRKYGQKEILGRKYPRGYYRCTHQKLYACPAKKQVQRLDDNPNIVEVTYRGDHTCHMSSTAPSSFPPQLLVVDTTQTTISPQLSPSSTSIPGWLSSANLSLSGSGGDGGGGGSVGGPSTSKFSIDYPVAEMADAMFNSGSSSGNSMKYLFAPNEEKWEPSEKKS